MPHEPFDLTLEELQNISLTVLKYRTRIRTEEEQVGKASDEARRKLKKALKVLDEQNFNNQFLR